MKSKFYRIIACSWFVWGILIGNAEESKHCLLIRLNKNDKGSPDINTRLVFPGTYDFLLQSPEKKFSWADCDDLLFDVFVEKDASPGIQIMIYLQDWDHLWYQRLLQEQLQAGITNRLRVKMNPAGKNNEEWQPVGHKGRWNLRSLIEPKEVGIRIFNKRAGEAKCHIANVACTYRKERDPPYIKNFKISRKRLPCFECLTLTFTLPDRYVDPFDSDIVDVSACFVHEDGEKHCVPGFYTQDYYIEPRGANESLIPQEAPYWCVKYTPCKPGVYKYTLKVKDAYGETTYGPEEFTVTPSQLPGFIRVSKKNPLLFEFDNGTAFFPIGHNIRSPYDGRMDKLFPWQQRWPEGISAYVRYFNDMRKYGENFTEIWMAAWTLALEWTDIYPGYHGLGQFNLINAWQLDRLIDCATTNGIYINLVIHNHGKFSTYCDEEWDDNPFNIKNGGYLKIPDEFFTDSRAKRAFLKLMRYIIARYGWSPNIFAWALWSEVDLTGSDKNRWNFQDTPSVIEWHEEMSRAIKSMDIYKHIISTHVSRDYRKMNKKLATIPSLDVCAADGYYDGVDAIALVRLMRGTYAFANEIKKPVLITEFGGSHMGHKFQHLKSSLHAGLWACAGIPLAGAPLFWWWQLIEETNLYPMYKAFKNFIQDENRVNMSCYSPRLVIDGQTASNLAVECMKTEENAIGWIYHTRGFIDNYPLSHTSTTNLSLILSEMTNGLFSVSFWDTTTGTKVSESNAVSQNGTVKLIVPPFIRDIAFKVKHVR
jgi:hypothetical protein